MYFCKTRRCRHSQVCCSLKSAPLRLRGLRKHTTAGGGSICRRRSDDLHVAATQTTFLRNVLVSRPEYRLSLKSIKAAPGERSEPFTQIPVFKPAVADTSIAFSPQPVANLNSGHWNWWPFARSAGMPVAEATVQWRNPSLPGWRFQCAPTARGNYSARL